MLLSFLNLESMKISNICKSLEQVFNSYQDLPHLHNLSHFPPQPTPCIEDLQAKPGPQLFHLYILQCAPQKNLGVFFHNHSAIITQT